MSKWEMIKGTFKTFWDMTKEDFEQMDHKLIRIGSMLIGFVIAFLFWFFLLRGVGLF